MFNKFLKTLLILSALSLFACKDEPSTYTLYRNSVVDSNMRIHVATFNSKNKSYGEKTSDTYNKGGCKLAASLFKKSQSIATEYWCEKGYFKK